MWANRAFSSGTRPRRLFCTRS